MSGADLGGGLPALRWRARTVRLSGAKLWTSLVACALCLSSSALLAQGAPAGNRGQLVRVQSPGETGWRGHLLAPLLPAASSATVCRGRLMQCEVDSARIVRVAHAEGTRLQLRTGSSWGKGALIGGAIGAGVATTWALLYHFDDASSAGDGRTGWIVLGTAAITGVGALIGGLIGSRKQHWKPVW